jgi:hypothetical protein
MTGASARRSLMQRSLMQRSLMQRSLMPGRALVRDSGRPAGRG